MLAVDLPGKDFAGIAESAMSIVCHAKDLAEPDAAEELVGAATSKFGRLDIVMNNAGIASNALVEAMDDDVWERTLGVNLTAQMRLCRAAIPRLKESPAGRIINVASVMAEGADYGLAAYCASKAGVAGLTRTLALELGRFAITANYIEPGAIATGMTMPLWSVRPDVAEIWAKKAALKRLGQPLDVARAALFLASDDGAFVTGHGLVVDGGLMLRV